MKRLAPAGLWVRLLVTALAVTSLSASAAHAGLEVKDLQEDTKYKILECEFPYCPVTLQFKILNNNKDDDVYSLFKYGEYLKSKLGDVDNDVVAEKDAIFSPDCSGNITVTSNCIVTLDLLVEDKNPSDVPQTDPMAKTPDSTFFWGVVVEQYFDNGMLISPGAAGPSNAQPVSVLDDTPEPSTWLLMGAGMTAAGGFLRRRQGCSAAHRFA